jgi:antitoxin component of RelBE/YafQ-DinJ toxin-antitoxin module
MTKTMSLRVNNDVYTMFTDVCNNEGITISQKLNRLVTDQIALLKEYEKDNKVEPEPLTDSQILDSMPRKTLEEKFRVLDSKTRKEKKFRIIDSKKKLSLNLLNLKMNLENI